MPSPPYLIHHLRINLFPDSTNKRVQSFAWLTLIALVALGVWQIVHLRSFFKRKYLID